MAKRKTTIHEMEALQTVVHEVSEGDVTGGNTPSEAKIESVKKRIRARINHQATALQDVIQSSETEDKVAVARQYLQNFPPQERMLILKLLTQENEDFKGRSIHPDFELAHGWRDGGYPYKNLMSRKNYELQKYDLQVELLKL